MGPHGFHHFNAAIHQILSHLLVMGMKSGSDFGNALTPPIFLYRIQTDMAFIISEPVTENLELNVFRLGEVGFDLLFQRCAPQQVFPLPLKAGSLPCWRWWVENKIECATFYWFR